MSENIKDTNYFNEYIKFKALYLNLKTSDNKQGGSPNNEELKDDVVEEFITIFSNLDTRVYDVNTILDLIPIKQLGLYKKKGKEKIKQTQTQTQNEYKIFKQNISTNNILSLFDLGKSCNDFISEQIPPLEINLDEISHEIIINKIEEFRSNNNNSNNNNLNENGAAYFKLSDDSPFGIKYFTKRTVYNKEDIIYNKIDKIDKYKKSSLRIFSKYYKKEWVDSENYGYIILHHYDKDWLPYNVLNYFEYLNYSEENYPSTRKFYAPPQYYCYQSLITFFIKVMYMHEHYGIIHGDLKYNNMFFNIKTFDIIFFDFDRSRLIKNNDQNQNMIKSNMSSKEIFKNIFKCMLHERNRSRLKIKFPYDICKFLIRTEIQKITKSFKL